MEGKLTHKLSVRLYRDEEHKCFGPGIERLLDGVARTHSLRAAAAEMGMAYSKAWRIIKESEAALGFDLLVSTAGGPHGGGAQMTPEGHALLERYGRFERALRLEADRLFDEIFLGFDD